MGLSAQASGQFRMECTKREARRPVSGDLALRTEEFPPCELISHYPRRRSQRRAEIAEMRHEAKG